jgi:thymidylate synthase (FAD)
MKVVPQSATLLHITEDASRLIERAGRVCYKSEDRICEGSDERLINGTLCARGHLSVLEHATATFLFVTDRGVSHELVRHRIAAYSQESTRYCNYGKDKFGQEITVIEPPFMTEKGAMLWQGTIEETESSYLAMLEAGEPPQIARSALPTCLKTEIVATMNFRQWLHVIELRTSSAAHPQIRELIGMAADQLAASCPIIFASAERTD